jgi:hypothetical protein
MGTREGHRNVGVWCGESHPQAGWSVSRQHSLIGVERRGTCRCRLRSLPPGGSKRLDAQLLGLPVRALHEYPPLPYLSIQPPILRRSIRDMATCGRMQGPGDRTHLSGHNLCSKLPGRRHVCMYVCMYSPFLTYIQGWRQLETRGPFAQAGTFFNPTKHCVATKNWRSPLGCKAWVPTALDLIHTETRAWARQSLASTPLRKGNGRKSLDNISTLSFASSVFDVNIATFETFARQRRFFGSKVNGIATSAARCQFTNCFDGCSSQLNFELCLNPPILMGTPIWSCSACPSRACA